ncbi:DUF3899 domain-containing protein [Thermicanus aegyptius]|uniref:DUF3899 domain-containing protein n=1 Tax=Thermicanus aegyptius TaxID=94009 RepID=UPI0003F719B6|nr:DUF3899 domain-containing protein [Thermicanus aegyptius]
MNVRALKIHIPIFLGILLFIILMAIRSEKPFLLSFINYSFLVGLFLFLVGSVILIILWGTFDLLVKGFSLFSRRLTKEEEELLDVEEGDREEARKERKEENLRLGFLLLTEGLLLVFVSFLLLPFLS